MKIGLLYESAYWPLLDQLILDLEYEIQAISGQSFRLTSVDSEFVNSVDVIYVLPYDAIAAVKRLEAKRLVINSTRSQEIAIDKIATSQLLMDNHLPTPETVISWTPEPVLEMLERRGTVLLKATRLCGGFGHRVLRREGSSVTTRKNARTYRVDFGEQNQIRDKTLILAPPYYAQAFIGADGYINDRVYRMYVVGNQVVMGTVRLKEGVKSPEESIINVATGARYQLMSAPDLDMASLALRVAALIGFDAGVVDFLRDAAGQPLIIEADCDGCYLFVCRKFQEAPGYTEDYNFNAYIARRLAENAGSGACWICP
jgi:glutathione synthase/RimK-type ligase-like ATP-grasp enzyme